MAKVEQVSQIITKADATHATLGTAAVLNTLWLELINPIIQVGLTVGGVVYLYYMIRAKRMEWKKSKEEYRRLMDGADD